MTNAPKVLGKLWTQESRQDIQFYLQHLWEAMEPIWLMVPSIVTLETLKDFHRERVQILANSVAHLIAFETTLNKLEAKAYAELLEEEAFDIPAWFTFASIDGISVGLISSIRKVTSKPIMILPNSGETYDGQSKQWVPSSGRVNEEIAEIVIEKWHEAGASLFGGCCRTTPNTMRAISKALSNKSSAVRDA